MRTVLRAGGMVDIPSLAEISATIEAGVGPALAAQAEQTAATIGGLREDVTGRMAAIEDYQRESGRAVKWMRFPRLQGVPSGNAIKLGVAKGNMTGPEQGYLWSVRRLVVTGLTASATAPDIVNFYYTDNTAGAIWWQLNGNSFGSTFNLGEMMMAAGETLNVASTGSIAATGTVIVDWDGWEVVLDQQWKLVHG